jgi:sugar phosphate isomerase/epimerase
MPFKIAAFTKSFQDWPVPLVCHRFREIGLDGLDLTVRPKGMIEPKDVAEQLPAAVRAAHEAGTEILLLTTNITQPDTESEKLLATAAKQGIHRIKLGYYRYIPFGTLVKQMDEVRRQLAAVIKLCKPYGVLPCVHIHSGADIPSHGTMLYELLRDFPPSDIGAYVDTLHMALEGGGEGWRQGLDLLAPWISMVAVKNFDWQAGPRDKFGQQRWHHRVVPVADGISPIPEFIETLRKAKFSGVFSLHSEYKEKSSFKPLDTEACLKQTAEDLKFLRKVLGQKS